MGESVTALEVAEHRRYIEPLTPALRERYIDPLTPPVRELSRKVLGTLVKFAVPRRG